MKHLKELITIDVYLTSHDTRILLCHNGVILAYLNSVSEAEKIISHPESVFKLSKERTDYHIINNDLSENFKHTHEFANY